MADKKTKKTKSGSQTAKKKQVEKTPGVKKRENNIVVSEQVTDETKANENPKKRKNDKLTGIILFIILVVLFVSVIYLAVRLFIPHSGWKTFEKSDLYEVFDDRGNSAYVLNQLKEPYVIIHSDLKDMEGLEDNYQVWDVLGCSEGLVTKNNLNKMKSIIICESGYDIRNYNKNGLSDGEYGYSEYVKIYAIDVETRGYYVGESGETLLDEMEATQLPLNASSTPRYKYRESSILKFVEENLESWFTY